MSRRALLAIGAVVCALVLVLGVQRAVQRTDAAWTDRVHADAAVTAGSWAPVAPAERFRCAPRDPASTATCTIEQKQWDFAGNNYTFGFHVSFSTGKHFPWVATFNLASPDNAFAGSPVPAGSWWKEWTPTTFSSWNACALSSTADLPLLVLSSSDKNQGTFGFSTSAANTGSSVEALACR